MSAVLNAIGCAIGVFIGHLLFDTSLLAMLGCWVVSFAIIQSVLEGY